MLFTLQILLRNGHVKRLKVLFRRLKFHPVVYERWTSRGKQGLRLLNPVAIDVNKLAALLNQ